MPECGEHPDKTGTGDRGAARHGRRGEDRTGAGDPRRIASAEEALLDLGDEGCDEHAVKNRIPRSDQLDKVPGGKFAGFVDFRKIPPGFAGELHHNRRTIEQDEAAPAREAAWKKEPSDGVGVCLQGQPPCLGNGEVRVIQGRKVQAKVPAGGQDGEVAERKRSLQADLTGLTAKPLEA